jgi:hypothetical protein
MRQHPSAFQVWPKRKNDKALQARLKFVEATRDLLSSPIAELSDTVEDSLGAKLMDPDDKVQAAVCRGYGGLDYETALHHVKTDQLRAAAGRGVDKKVCVCILTEYVLTHFKALSKYRWRHCVRWGSCIRSLIPRCACFSIHYASAECDTARTKTAPPSCSSRGPPTSSSR